jgi:uncharacterized protein YigE (DUF2233 family)
MNATLRKHGVLLALILLLPIPFVAKWYFAAQPSFTRWPAGSFGASTNDIDLYDIRLDSQHLALYWKNVEGQCYRNAEALAKALGAQGKQLLFAINSGIYGEGPDGCPRPLGLHIEQGKTLVPLNTTRTAHGNFYLQPNGVFWWKAGEAHCVTTDDFATSNAAPDFALQSGPMLVHEGAINPRFDAESRNVQLRAGIGVTESGAVVIAFTNTPVSLYDLAAAFKKAGCAEALYLDGAIVSRHLNGYASQTHGDMAGIIALTK